MLSYAVILCILGFGTYYLAAPLGWIGFLTAALSMGAAGMMLRFPRTGVRTLFLACLLFHTAGFTVIAYPSAREAYGRYGDFHGGIADANYANILLRPWRAAPALGLFFAEGKITKGVIDFIWPPAGESENLDAAVEAIIVIGIISRTAALVLFYLLVQSVSMPSRAAAAALLIFTFQYTNIALAQSMKFVAGLPFFMFWLFSFSEYERTGCRRWLAAHAVTLILLLFSQQWIIFFVAALYLIYPFFKQGAGFPLRGSDVLGTAFVASASTALYFIERGRMADNRLFLLPLVPSAFRSPYLHEYPTLFLFFAIAVLTSFFIYHKATEFSGKKLLSFCIMPSVIFMQSLIFLNPALFFERDFLLPVLPYWLLVSCSLFMIIRSAFIAREIDAVSVLAFSAWIIGSLPHAFLIMGISMPTSPVLDVLILPLLVLAAGKCSHKAFPLLFAFVVLVGFLSTFKFIAYADGWERMAAFIPVILAPVALTIARKYRYA